MKALTVGAILAVGLNLFTSCSQFLDVNEDPNNIKKAQISQMLPSITVNVGYMGASDLFRVSSVFIQQFSGHGPVAGFSANKEYERYNVNDSDINNQWVSIFATVLSDLELLIEQATAEGSPHYAGVAKILKAYVYQIVVDTWGDVPFYEASKHTANFYPAFDDDEAIYTELIALLNDGLANIKAEQSALSPNQYSTIYSSSSWESSRNQWERFANTLKLRIYLHYSAKDPSFTAQQLNDLINSGAPFMQSNLDNFEMPFLAESQRQNPLYSAENGQFKNQFFPHRYLVDLMNDREDPRRSAYFIPFPYYSEPATYKGSSMLEANPSLAYSRSYRYLYGTPSAVDPALVNADGSLKDGAITFGGDSPARLMNFSEYNFIRAEAALRYGVAGDAQYFFAEGIKASFEQAGLSSQQLQTYLAQHGVLTGTQDQQLEQIITEKYIANFGVLVEPWTDYRRTGYPRLTPLSQPQAIYNEVPRSLYYAQSEINNNPNANQKSNMLERVFWDVQ
ncbi:SusD/RagB family nutrient-binding outer membrane lipoprotein [Olivibacter sp. XZL3]|uniref:SusD/RagB family nutrient-binding outer membrane lipoprotein n=1 Tax=Olivibacter sp. XZL3 TaxID=1735116 RepID=UPI001066AFA9|nr:SusD/RagB family nutrient-binding outer membrane lipoprotein [Olivibacter sp. XZL3]